jgi:hypothetical protein
VAAVAPANARSQAAAGSCSIGPPPPPRACPRATAHLQQQRRERELCALELRHYFTNEETATLSFIFSTFSHNFPSAPHYQDEGGGNVLSGIAPLVPAKANASQFISIKFNATPGSFGNDEWAQLGFYGMYPMKSNQANDYTYVGHPTTDPGSANKTVGWQRTTLYVSGELVWGCEP